MFLNIQYFILFHIITQHINNISYVINILDQNFWRARYKISTGNGKEGKPFENRIKDFQNTKRGNF